VSTRDLIALQEILGHASIKATQRTPGWAPITSAPRPRSLRRRWAPMS